MSVFCTACAGTERNAREPANITPVIAATAFCHLFMMVFLYFIYGNNKIRIADIDNGQ